MSTTITSLLEQIIATGNRGYERHRPGNIIACTDGFSLSVLAGAHTYCTPRPDWPTFGDQPAVPADYPGPYTHVEVGYPSAQPEPWDQWQQYCDGGDDPTRTVYGYVPVDLVRALVAAHGGEAS